MRQLIAIFAVFCDRASHAFDDERANIGDAGSIKILIEVDGVGQPKQGDEREYNEFLDHALYEC